MTVINSFSLENGEMEWDYVFFLGLHTEENLFCFKKRKIIVLLFGGEIKLNP